MIRECPSRHMEKYCTAILTAGDVNILLYIEQLNNGLSMSEHSEIKTLKAIDEVRMDSFKRISENYNMVNQDQIGVLAGKEPGAFRYLYFIVTTAMNQLLTDETINNVAEIFEKESSDAWI